MNKRKETSIYLEDLDFIKSIEAVDRYMNFGVSGQKDKEEKIDHHEILKEKIIESQKKIENQFDLIELFSDNQLQKRKKGALFEKKDILKIFRTNTKRKSKNMFFFEDSYLKSTQSIIILFERNKIQQRIILYFNSLKGKIISL